MGAVLPCRAMACNNGWANHGRLLLHLFQHQVHHRAQVHAMLSTTEVRPAQLDAFFSAGEALLRATEFAELGWTEDTVWAS